MSLSREEQLELVARASVGWPISKIELWAYWNGTVLFDNKKQIDRYIEKSIVMERFFFTRSEVEAKRREITGEPDKTQHNFNQIIQNRDGEWLGHISIKEHHPCRVDWHGWQKIIIDGHCVKGEVIGDWRDTLKQIKREEKEMENVEFVYGSLYVSAHRKEKSRFVALVIGDPTSGVFTDEKGYYEASLSDMKPAPSERDEFVSQVLYCFDEKYADQPTPDCTVRLSEMIFDAISEGLLKAPEVKK